MIWALNHVKLVKEIICEGAISINGLFRTICDSTYYNACFMHLCRLLGLNAVRLDQFFKKGFPLQVQVIMIFLAIVIGTSVSNFIIDLLQFSTQIKYLF